MHTVRAAQLQAIFRFTPLVLAVNCANVIVIALALRTVASPLALATWALLPVAGITPDRLELEITQALLLANDSVTMKFLHEMQDIGIGVALDDFGIGFSSLNYLTRFPVSKIKIDRSFVSGGASHVHRSAIIQAVTGMADRLGFSTTAEGVETAETLAWVTGLGCTQAQGYLFAKAMPAQDIPAYLAAEFIAASEPTPAAAPDERPNPGALQLLR